MTLIQVVTALNDIALAFPLNLRTYDVYSGCLATIGISMAKHAPFLGSLAT